jgi:hypothetical protein
LLSRTIKSAQSIRNYINGVKVLFLLLGLDIEKFSSYVLKLTFRGLDRKLQHLSRQTLPNTLDILDKLYDHMNFNSSIGVTYWCLFLFAFFLLSRKSNLVPDSVKKFDSSRQLCRGDMTVCSIYLIVRFKWTKTIQFGNRVLSIPLLTFPVSNFCPVQAFKAMCSMHPCLSSSFQLIIKETLFLLLIVNFSID